MSFLAKLYGGGFFKITDIAGKTILENNYSIKVNVSTLTPGAYFIELSGNNTAPKTSRFIKQE